MFPTRPPTKRRVRRLTATATGALLAVAGMTGIAAPAQASVVRPEAAAGLEGCQLSVLGQHIAYPVNDPISCTMPHYGTWYTGKTQTQTGDSTLRNVSSYPIRLVPIQYSAPVSPGNKSWHIGLIPSSGVTLNPGQGVTVSVQTTFDGPFQKDVTNGDVFAEIEFHAYSSHWSRAAYISAAPGYPAVDTASTTSSYGLSVSASPSGPRTGQASTITATNTSRASEHLALCGGGKMLAAGIHPPGGKLVHAVRSSTAGTETFTVVAGARYMCSGSPSKTFTVDWTGTAPPAARSLAVAGDGGEPAGHPDRLFVADTGPRGAPAEWLTMCVNGRPVASGLHAPGTVLVHAVTGPSVGSTVTVDAYADASPGACSGVERTFTVTGLSAGPTVTVTNLHAFASAASVTVGAKVQTWVTDTATGPTWATLCQAGRPIASAWLHPGQGMPHAVAAATAGSVTYAAMQGKASCSSGDESSVTVTWTAAS